MIIPNVIFKDDTGHPMGLDIFSRLLKDRIIFFNDVVTSDTAGLVVAQMVHLATLNKDPVHFYINSPGGSVLDGLSIIDAVRILSEQGCPVHTYGIGKQASFGSLLLICGKNGQRRIFKNSLIMVHSITSSSSGSLPSLEEELKLTKLLNGVITDLYTSHTKLSREDMERIFHSPDTWFDAVKAVEFGIADEII